MVSIVAEEGGATAERVGAVSRRISLAAVEMIGFRESGRGFW